MLEPPVSIQVQLSPIFILAPIRFESSYMYITSHEYID